jgi:hypothetical protein
VTCPVQQRIGYDPGGTSGTFHLTLTVTDEAGETAVSLATVTVL